MKNSSNNSNKKPRVLVGMSGGVDSSVAAALLVKQGYEVIGAFLKFDQIDANKCTNKCEPENKCCNYDSLIAAREVCNKLGIPFYVFDVSKQFKNEIINYFINEYENGRTPNPCVVCNKKIKFGWMLDQAKKLGCDFIATGHYARIQVKSGKSEVKIQNPKLLNHRLATRDSRLLLAKDKQKDQTYFLWQLDQDQLNHIIFPLGEYLKSEVRIIAQKLKLVTAKKKESQDLCFINKDKSDFLQKHTKKLNKPGSIIDLNGNVLGRHVGLCYYTVGQRKGLKIQLKTVDSSFKSAYVIKLDLENNQLIVGFEKDLFSKSLIANSCRWINTCPDNGFDCWAKIRFGQKKEKCKIKVLDNVVQVDFVKPVRGITPGQSIVFYNKNEIIGGGIIN